MEIAVEKLFDDMDCPANGGVIQLERVNDKRNGVNKILVEVIKGNYIVNFLWVTMLHKTVVFIF